MPVKTVVTDMSTRERRKFGEQLQGIAKMTEMLAEAIVTERDADALRLGILWAQCLECTNKELAEIYNNATKVEIPDAPPPADPLSNFVDLAIGDNALTGLEVRLDEAGPAGEEGDDKWPTEPTE